MLTIAKPLFSIFRTGLMVSAVALTLSACGTTNWGFPYRADIQQGNWITAEQVAKLQKGMSREQVRFILGTPSLQDIFHSNRWDYPYYNNPGYGDPQERKFTVWFKGDVLDHWAGDPQPDRQPFQKSDTGMNERSSAADDQNETKANDAKAGANTHDPAQSQADVDKKDDNQNNTDKHNTPTPGNVFNVQTHRIPGAPSPAPDRMPNEPLR